MRETQSAVMFIEAWNALSLFLPPDARQGPRRTVRGASHHKRHVVLPVSAANVVSLRPEVAPCLSVLYACFRLTSFTRRRLLLRAALRFIR